MTKLLDLPRCCILSACLFACIAGGCRHSPNPSTQPATATSQPATPAPQPPELSPRTQVLVNQLIEMNRYESENASEQGPYCGEVHAIFVELDKVATEAELRALTNHENPAVRVYAFEGLAKRLGIQVIPVLLAHLDDNQYLIGELEGFGRAGDMMFDMVNRGQLAERITGVSRTQIIEGLLQKSSKLKARWYVLANWTIPQSRQPNARELALRMSADPPSRYDWELTEKIKFLEKCLSEDELNAYVTKGIQADAANIGFLNGYLLGHKPAAVVPILFKIVADKSLPAYERIEAVTALLGYEKPEVTERLKKMWKDGAIRVTGAQAEQDKAAFRELLE